MKTEKSKPEICKIGFRDFKIEFKNKVISNDFTVLYGQIKSTESKIEISDGYDMVQQKATLVHEIMHELNDYYADSKFDEQDIVRISNGLFEVIKNNKEVFEWLIEE